MPKSPDRAKLSRLVDAYDRISEESLGMGDPEFHEIEDQLFDAIVDSRYRAVIKNGNIYLLVFCKVRLTPVELQHVHRVAPIW